MDVFKAAYDHILCVCTTRFLRRAHDTTAARTCWQTRKHLFRLIHYSLYVMYVDDFRIIEPRQH